MTQKERMLAELLYSPADEELQRARTRAKNLCYAFNNTPPTDYEKGGEILHQLLGKHGQDVWMEQPFHCDYGSFIEVGDHFFANYNCIILDVARVVIGNNVMFAPNVSIYTAGHPLHPETRNSGYEYGISITIGDNVWIGGNSVINPGVHIGNNVVIGSGSVVTRDIPDNVIAAGNPARILREITEEDRNYYYKKREFSIN